MTIRLLDIPEDVYLRIKNRIVKYDIPQDIKDRIIQEYHFKINKKPQGFRNHVARMSLEDKRKWSRNLVLAKRKKKLEKQMKNGLQY